jgi:hypothetical protein
MRFPWKRRNDHTEPGTTRRILNYATPDGPAEEPDDEDLSDNDVLKKLLGEVLGYVALGIVTLGLIFLYLVCNGAKR